MTKRTTTAKPHGAARSSVVTFLGLAAILLLGAGFWLTRERTVPGTDRTGQAVGIQAIQAKIDLGRVPFDRQVEAARQLVGETFTARRHGMGTAVAGISDTDHQALGLPFRNQRGDGFEARGAAVDMQIGRAHV